MFSNHAQKHTVRVAAIIVLSMLVITNLSLAANAATYSWTKLNTAQSLPARAGFAAAYDPISKKVVVFGGYNATSQLNETWTFDEPPGHRCRLQPRQPPAPLRPWPTIAKFIGSSCSADFLVLPF